MAEDKKYYIRVPRALVEVTQEVYLAYYQELRFARTLAEKDRRNGTVSYDQMDTSERFGQEMFSDRDAVSVEDAAIAKILKDKLRRCLEQLSEPEWELISALFFEGLSERKYAEKLGISQNAVNKRCHKVLSKLRSMMNN